MKNRFKVTITEQYTERIFVKTIKAMKNRFKVTITEQYTDGKTSAYQKLSDTGNPKDNGAIWGYVESPEEYIREREILVLNIEHLDIKHVTKAILQL